MSVNIIFRCQSVLEGAHQCVKGTATCTISGVLLAGIAAKKYLIDNKQTCLGRSDFSFLRKENSYTSYFQKEFTGGIGCFNKAKEALQDAINGHPPSLWGRLLRWIR